MPFVNRKSSTTLDVNRTLSRRPAGVLQLYWKLDHGCGAFGRSGRRIYHVL